MFGGEPFLSASVPKRTRKFQPTIAGSGGATPKPATPARPLTRLLPSPSSSLSPSLPPKAPEVPYVPEASTSSPLGDTLTSRSAPLTHAPTLTSTSRRESKPSVLDTITPRGASLPAPVQMPANSVPIEPALAAMLAEHEGSVVESQAESMTESVAASTTGKKRKRRKQVVDEVSADPQEISLREVIRSCRRGRTKPKQEEEKPTSEVAANDAAEPDAALDTLNTTDITHAPRVELLPSGEIRVVEEPLPPTDMADASANFEQIDETTKVITSRTWAKWSIAEPWTEADTDKFFDGLKTYGTNFTVLEALFPGRSRKQLSTKFKREEKKNPRRVKDALRGGNTYTPAMFQEILGRQMGSSPSAPAPTTAVPATEEDSAQSAPPASPDTTARAPTPPPVMASPPATPPAEASPPPPALTIQQAPPAKKPRTSPAAPRALPARTGPTPLALKPSALPANAPAVQDSPAAEEKEDTEKEMKAEQAPRPVFPSLAAPRLKTPKARLTSLSKKPVPPRLSSPHKPS